jgi:hypothetical protein
MRDSEEKERERDRLLTSQDVENTPVDVCHKKASVCG